MNGIMRQKLRKEQDSDKSLPNFTKRSPDLGPTLRRRSLRCQALLELGGKLLSLLARELQLTVKHQA
jgi:hypothetical protein